MPLINTFGVPIVLLSSIQDIFIDVVEQVTVRYENLVSSNPTEVGLNVSDNIVNLPVVISIAGRFVDAPFAVDGQDIGFNALQAFSTAQATGLEGGLSVQQWDALVQLRDSKELFDVVIQHGVFHGLAFSSLTGPRGKGDGTSMRFQAEMRQLLITGIAPTVAGNNADDVAYSADGAENIGPQPTSQFF